MFFALESGRSSWTLPLDARRLRPDDDATEVTAGQIRELVGRLRACGQHGDGDLPVLIVMDAGYDVVRLAWLLGDLPVQLVARVRSDRVFYLPALPLKRATAGRPRRHGDRLKLADPTTWPQPQATHTGVHDRYGKVTIRAWGRMHPKLARNGGWARHTGTLPIVQGTLIYVQVQRLPGARQAKPLWLWYSNPEVHTVDLARVFAVFLRRFDAEHTFRFFKQRLVWTHPRVRSPQQADRWTWLIIIAYTQLWLARGLADDLRRPWERPLAPDQLTPARVRRGFRRIRRRVGLPASAPKPTRPGPGRPKGSRNRRPAPRYPVGKQAKMDTTAHQPTSVRRERSS
jgi:hypothetical protein